MIDEALERYGRLVSEHPLELLAICLALSLAAFIGASNIGMESMDTADMLPGDIEVVSAMSYIEDEFGVSSDSGKIVIEIDPKTANSTEIRDVRDIRVVEYADSLAKKAAQLEGVSSASSVADYLHDGSHLLRSEKKIKERLKETPAAMSYISEDYSMSLVKLMLMPNPDEEQLYIDLGDIIDQTPAPEGLKVSRAGNYAMSFELSEQIGPDMGKTSLYSMIGILFVIFFIVFRAFDHGIISMMAIVFGVLWSYGLMGFSGMTLSSATAGAASMIMGIGIDFGIQVVSRFRHEINASGYALAMTNTLKGVTVPMTTTTLAALIGFRAMTLGQLSMLADLGTVMSLGVLCCMLSALTIIPTLLVIREKYFRKEKK